MNLKPFNLEEALAGKPVVTWDGRKVTEIYHFKTANQKNFPITAIIYGGKCGYSLDGRFINSGETNYDLFMAPETLNVWLNVWRFSDGKIFTTSEEEEPESSIQSKRGYIKTVPVTIEL